MKAESIIGDGLADIVPADAQRLAARMAQDAFAHIFRLTLDGDAKALAESAEKLETQAFNWSRAGKDREAQALRMALLISGLDQWGLAYSQAFGLTAIPALSALLGGLRQRLDPGAEARFQGYFGRVAHGDGDVVDFKIELRRNIHLALWHAMAACATNAEAEAVLKALGGMLLALLRDMPQLGWRLLADALASIQICLLSEAAAVSPLAQENTQKLFESLRQAVDAEIYSSVSRHANQAILAWQQARRAAH